MQEGEIKPLLSVGKRLLPPSTTKLQVSAVPLNKHGIVRTKVNRTDMPTQESHRIAEDFMSSINLAHMNSLMAREKDIALSRKLAIEGSPSRRAASDLLQKTRESIQKHRLNLKVPAVVDSQPIATMEMQFKQARNSPNRRYSVRTDRQLGNVLSPTKDQAQEDTIRRLNRQRMHSYRVATLDECEQELELLVRQTQKTLHKNLRVLNTLEAKLMQ